MSKGFIVYAIKKDTYEPGFLKFTYGKMSLVTSAKEAVIYPTYQAAEAVANAMNEDENYLYAEVLDADGNPCPGEKSVASTDKYAL